MRKGVTSMDMNAGRWEVMLSRWSDFPASPEKKFMCWAIGQFIHAEKKELFPFSGVFFDAGGGFDAYCKAINIDPQFVRQQVQRADEVIPTLDPCFFTEQGERDREAMNGR